MAALDVVLNLKVTEDQVVTVIASIIGLCGVIIGVIITSIVNWNVKSKEARLRILEKIFDKRLSAHEEVLEIARLLRTTVSTRTTDEGNNVITYPAVIANKQVFDDFQGRFYELVNFNTHWLDIKLFRELNYVQDYIANVDIMLKDKSEQQYVDIATIIKNDFIELAASLEKETKKFFGEDIYKMKISLRNEPHKFKKEETIKRLQNTILHKRWKEINDLYN